MGAHLPFTVVLRVWFRNESLRSGRDLPRGCEESDWYIQVCTVLYRYSTPGPKVIVEVTSKGSGKVTRTLLPPGAWIKTGIPLGGGLYCTSYP